MPRVAQKRWLTAGGRFTASSLACAHYLMVHKYKVQIKNMSDLLYALCELAETMVSNEGRPPFTNEEEAHDYLLTQNLNFQTRSERGNVRKSAFMNTSIQATTAQHSDSFIYNPELELDASMQFYAYLLDKGLSSSEAIEIAKTKYNIE